MTSWQLWNDRSAQLGDLFGQVVGSAEHGIDQVALLVGCEVRVDVLPHHVACGGNLKHPAKVAFRNQRVAVGQATGAGDVGAEEVERRVIGVLPYDFVGGRVHFDDPRMGQGSPARWEPLS